MLPQLSLTTDQFISVHLQFKNYIFSLFFSAGDVGLQRLQEGRRGGDERVSRRRCQTTKTIDAPRKSGKTFEICLIIYEGCKGLFEKHSF